MVTLFLNLWFLNFNQSKSIRYLPPLNIMTIGLPAIGIYVMNAVGDEMNYKTGFRYHVWYLWICGLDRFDAETMFSAPGNRVAATQFRCLLGA